MPRPRSYLLCGIGYNAEGLLIAANVDELHSEKSRVNKDTAVTERLDPVNGVGDNPKLHDILTGPSSRWHRLSR